VPSSYPPLNLAVRTPRLSLAAATDDLLDRLVPVVRAGLVTLGAPAPFDDPMSLYEDGPSREAALDVQDLGRPVAGRCRVLAVVLRDLRRR
jgi:hypothetical protein